MALLSAAAGLVLPADAQPPEAPSRGEPIFRVTDTKSNLRVVERFSTTVETRTRITRVDGFDPEVINVTALAPNQVRVQAITPGVTTMVLFDEQGEMYSIEVFVAGDVRHLQAYINQMFPKAAVEAVAVRGAVALNGWVTQPEHITELIEIAEQFYPKVLNQIRVGGVQQVLLKVKVMEVQRSKLRQLGFNFLFVNRDGFLASTPGQLTPLGALTAEVGGVPSAAVGATSLADPTVAFGVLGNTHVFQGFVEALKQEGLLKIRAEPTLVTTNGRPATLLNGGEFPILVPQSLGTVTIEWKQFGVRLEAVPIILGGGRLRLELSPEVSERDFSNSVEVNGLKIPGVTSRRVNTQVEMRFGQTLMIAGLISNRQTAETDKIPFFGELPWIGAAFRRERFTETETELVVLVTPEFVAPLESDQVPPGGPGQFTDSPTDRELYGNGYLEVPKIAEPCEGCPPPGMFGPVLPGGGHYAPGPAPGSPYGDGLLLPAPSGVAPPPVPPAPAYDAGMSDRSRQPAAVRPVSSTAGPGAAGLRPGSRRGLIEPKPGLIKPASASVNE